MNFRRGRHREEPEINFIPLIDVMLVILIFVMATTTYSKFAELQINLPTADAEKSTSKALEIEIGITAGGQYTVAGQRINFTGIDNLAADLLRAAKGQKEPVIIISADGNATHQSVVNAMTAAEKAGFGRLTFTIQTPP